MYFLSPLSPIEYDLNHFKIECDRLLSFIFSYLFIMYTCVYIAIQSTIAVDFTLY